MSVPFPERKVSVRVLQDLGATNETVLEVVKKGSCAEARVDDTGKRTPVIIRKADSYPIQSLLDKLELFNVPFQGFTDFFVFADLNLQEVAKVEAIPEVDRVFPDEKVTGYLDCSCETTKARATWNTFGHYGEDITWAVVDSGINDSHPHFAGPNALLQRGSYPNWWQNFEQKEWFKEKFQGPKMKINIEPGYPNNRVVLRIHLVNGGNINPHGTHVAGIIAGKQPEGEAEVEIPNGTPIRVKGIQGLAPQAKLVDFRVLDADATGIASDAISALYIIRKINEEAGNTVIAGANLSLGYETILWVWEFGVGSSPLCEEVDRLGTFGRVGGSSCGKRRVCGICGDNIKRHGSSGAGATDSLQFPEYH